VGRIEVLQDIGDDGDHCINSESWVKVCTIDEFNQCVEDCSGNFSKGNIAKPVYTQAMQEVGILPSVGMECYIDGTLVIYVVVLTGDSEGDFILTPKEGDKYWQRSNVKYIKPIDTRTDTEKCASDLDKLGYNCNISLINSIKAGKVHGVTFTESK